MNIYVGNLPFSATEDEVREAFSAYGQVASVSLIRDKLTDKPRGFGFIEMSDDAEAQAAIQALNGKDFKGRSLVVNPARPKEDRGDRRPMGAGGGFGDRRGGFGGDRGGRPNKGGGDRRRW